MLLRFHLFFFFGCFMYSTTPNGASGVAVRYYGKASIPRSHLQIGYISSAVPRRRQWIPKWICVSILASIQSFAIHPQPSSSLTTKTIQDIIFRLPGDMAQGTMQTIFLIIHPPLGNEGNIWDGRIGTGLYRRGNWQGREKLICCEF